VAAIKRHSASTLSRPYASRLLGAKHGEGGSKVV
jgi:hypothetical protein